MKRTIALLACLLALTACGSQSEPDQAANSQAADKSNSNASAENASSSQASDSGGDFDSNDDKRSYALGMDIGNSLKELPVELNIDMLAQGVRDVVKGNDTRLSQKQLESVMQGFVQDMQSAQKKKAAADAQQNLKKGKKFLADNKKKDGVKVTDSGLQYKVIDKGDGPSPDANDKVTVHYQGKLIDGTVFDSSRKRGEPVTFPVDAVIPGWTEALQLMKQGAEYKLFIPPDLAYGERGAGAQIGPNQTLIFDVKLLKVNKQKGTKPADSAGPSSGGSSQDKTGSGSSDSGNADVMGDAADAMDDTDRVAPDSNGDSQSGPTTQ